MRITHIGRRGSWRSVADAARTTVGLEAGQGDPSSDWKRRMLLCEHSPIRKIIINWTWADLLWWVQTHFTRHHAGVEWFVKTSRADRTGIPRESLSQSALVNVEGDANAQAVISISRKRLCCKASPETREAWKTLLEALKPIEPELYSVCVPDCIYRGYCYEYKTCGYYLTDEFQARLTEYRGEGSRDE